MSAENQLPDVDAANALRWEKVIIPTFLAKCASVYGLTSDWPGEADKLVEIGLALVKEAETREVKLAADHPYARAAEDIGQATGRFGATKTAAEARAIGRVAESFLADDSLYNAYLSVKAAQCDAHLAAIGYAPAAQ